MRRDSMIGTTLLHYKIVSRLGAGGMGIVYRARHTESGDERALKMISAGERLPRIERWSVEPLASHRVERVELPHPEILAALEPGHRLLLDDGKVRLRVTHATRTRATATVETGSRAAALGGWTAVHAMANTDPVADTGRLFRSQGVRGQSDAILALNSDHFGRLRTLDRRDEQPPADPPVIPVPPPRGMGLLRGRVLLASGEVVMTNAYNGRIATANEKDKKNFKIAWTNNLYTIDSWVIMKGTPNKADAEKYLVFVNDPQNQKNLPSKITYGVTAKADTRIVQMRLVAPKSERDLQRLVVYAERGFSSRQDVQLANSRATGPCARESTAASATAASSDSATFVRNSASALPRRSAPSPTPPCTCQNCKRTSLPRSTSPASATMVTTPICRLASPTPPSTA